MSVIDWDNLSKEDSKRIGRIARKFRRIEDQELQEEIEKLKEKKRQAEEPEQKLLEKLELAQEEKADRDNPKEPWESATEEAGEDKAEPPKEPFRMPIFTGLLMFIVGLLAYIIGAGIDNNYVHWAGILISSLFVWGNILESWKQKRIADQPVGSVLLDEAFFLFLMGGLYVFVTAFLWKSYAMLYAGGGILAGFIVFGYVAPFIIWLFNSTISSLSISIPSVSTEKFSLNIDRIYRIFSMRPQETGARKRPSNKT